MKSDHGIFFIQISLEIRLKFYHVVKEYVNKQKTCDYRTKYIKHRDWAELFV